MTNEDRFVEAMRGLDEVAAILPPTYMKIQASRSLRQAVEAFAERRALRKVL
jgi:hypothetical protein